MSVDNGIYIAEFSDGWRVIVASAIGNIFYYPKDSQKRKDEIKRYFGGSKIIATEDEAWLEAKRMYNDFFKNPPSISFTNDDDEIEEMEFDPVLEYGVSSLGKLEDFN